MTVIVVALITGVFGLLGIWFQAKVHRDNRSDHSSTAEAVDRLSAKVDDLSEDVRIIRRDVRDLKDDDRALDARMKAVEKREVS